MPNLQILFTKAKDPGSKDVLACIRQDGSRTWSKLHAAFPIHDMTHFAVETEMCAKHGFFGLIAQGWDISDFGIPEKRATLPLEALWVEHVVGVIWHEYVTREATPYEEFSAAIEATLSSLRDSLIRNSQRGGPRAEYSSDEKQIIERGIPEENRTRIVAHLGQLAASWAHTQRGEILELSFDSSK